jgi:hypothetical protein
LVAESLNPLIDGKNLLKYLLKLTCKSYFLIGAQNVPSLALRRLIMAEEEEVLKMLAACCFVNFLLQKCSLRRKEDFKTRKFKKMYYKKRWGYKMYSIWPTVVDVH